MYAIEIGRKFLQLYNERERKAKGLPEYSARAFFDEVYYPTMLNADNIREQLIDINNSSFFQKEKSEFKPKDEKKINPEYRLKRFHESIETISKNRGGFDGAILAGGGPKETSSATSGQSSSFNYPINDEQVYLSWIGHAFSFRISPEKKFGKASGKKDLPPVYCLLWEEELINHLFEGWKKYKEFLAKNTTVFGRGIELWNAFWLIYGYGNQLNEEVVFSQISSAFQKPNIKWWEICTYMVAKKIEFKKAYFFHLDNSNVTLGFMDLNLEPFLRMAHFWKKVFGSSTLPDAFSEIRTEFETRQTIYDMVQYGGLSILNLKPSVLEEVIEGKENSLQKRKITKTWLMALLNDQQLFDLSIELAEFFKIYVNQVGSSSPKHNVENFLNAKTRDKILEIVSEISEDVVNHLPEKVNFLKRLKQIIALEIPQQRLFYFLLLTKIEHQLLSK